ncbi:MAG: AtpZ/AtpI family protein [Candidatus Dormibacteria bacterium]|jgi:F0F1-type ATP synthase assembly protein I
MPSDRARGLSGTELIGLGVFLAAAFVVPLIAGLVIDQLAHTTPAGLLVGLVVGIAAAGFGLRAQMRRYL